MLIAHLRYPINIIKLLRFLNYAIVTNVILQPVTLTAFCILSSPLLTASMHIKN
jgi:hypothetical protein